MITREPPGWRLIVGSVVLVLGILIVAKDKSRSEAIAPSPGAPTSSIGP
jgi:drug/metabolite transporter (DMT)-like permease